MARQLLIATGNKGKLVEFKSFLKGLDFELTDPVEQGLDILVEEDGQTYSENAFKKATAYAAASGLLTLADDSGLEVDALGGDPGVHTARFGGPGLEDAERNAYLLEKIRDVPWEKRTATFRCIIVVLDPKGVSKEFEGTCRGLIAHTPKGRVGFGYDPIFYYPPLGKTVAELPEEVKQEISHRGKAARGAIAALSNWPGPKVYS